MRRTPYDLIRGIIAGRLGQGSAGVRDFNQSFGYPNTVTADDLMDMYLRNGVASRIVRAYPQATWRDYPLVRDEVGNSSRKEVNGKKNKNYSPFVEEVENFFDQHKVTHYLERADRLSGIGRFGILIMGFSDGGRLDEPLKPGKHKLTYLAAYGEPRVTVLSFEGDQSNERYSLPTMYQVTPDTSVKGGGQVPNMTFKVHHSRVLHLAEHLDENEVLGTPRLLPIFNHLLDLGKVLGSGAETFWLNARGGMSITADKEADIDAEVLADMKQQAEEFESQLRRIIALQGATANMLQSNVADPKSNVDALLQLIAGGSGIPLRILVGSERGELSSEQDENNWSARIDERQETYATPSIVRPFVTKMIETGNIKKPATPWWVEWPTSASMSPAQAAEVALKKTQALAAYSNAPAAELYVPAEEFRADFLGLTPESEYVDQDQVELDEADDEVIEQFVGTDDEVAANKRKLTVVGEKLVGNKRIKTNAEPMTLYVRRQVLNAEEIRAHFAAQGIDPMTPADEMHVTLAYSRTPVDWMKIEPIWNNDWNEELTVPQGGARLMSLFGKVEKNVLVLQFSNSQLSWRFEDFNRAGASWDWPSFEPHVTITYDVSQSWGNGLAGIGRQFRWEEKLKALEPWRGRIVLGPEIFETLNEDWRGSLTENMRA